MKLGYHGTSYEAGLEILKNGYRNDVEKYWTVSTGNMYVFAGGENDGNRAALQGMPVGIKANSRKRSVVVVDIENMNTVADMRATDTRNAAYEIKQNVRGRDIVAIYTDVVPLHPIYRVIGAVVWDKMHKSPLQNEKMTITKELSEEERVLFDIFHEVKTNPNIEFVMERTYVKRGWSSKVPKSFISKT